MKKKKMETEKQNRNQNKMQNNRKKENVTSKPTDSVATWC